jgi:hypothetical protein
MVSRDLVDGLSVDGEGDGDVSAGRVRVWAAPVCAQHQFARVFSGDVRCVQVERDLQSETAGVDRSDADL